MSQAEDSEAVSLSDVLEAHNRIKDDVHYTPLMRCSHLNSLAGLDLFFKCELFQKTGSFKIRGVTNAVKKLMERDGDSATSLTIVTESGGNHSQAVALTARNCGIAADIVMPNNCSPVKIRATQEYGAKVTLCPPTEQCIKEATDSLMTKYAPRAAYVPSASHPDIMAGHGTISIEFLEQVSDLDAIVASVSRGGLLAGIAVTAKALRPGIKIVGAEPENADECARSFAAGKIVSNETWPDTVCDALKANITELTWSVIRTHASGVVTVSEEEIIAAMKMVWERMNITIEPSAACSVAAVLSPKFKELAGPEVKRVGVVLCGGNVDLDSNLPWTKTIA